MKLRFLSFTQPPTSLHLHQLHSYNVFRRVTSSAKVAVNPLKISSLSSRSALPSTISVRSRRDNPQRRIILVTCTASGDGAKPMVLVAEKLGEAGVQLLEKFANVDCSYNLTLEELNTKISLCDALIVRSGTKVGREVFESSRGRLKVVGRAGVGIDNVDLSAEDNHTKKEKV